MAVAHPQRGADKAQRQPGHLYQVSSRDKGRMRFGFINRTGKPVIDFDRLPERTVAVGEFHEGRAVIYLGKTKDDTHRGNMNYTVGYIDMIGNMIIAPRFDEARDFSEGLAYVEEEGQGVKGFINLEGKVVIKLDGLIAKDFHEGRAAVGKSKNEWEKKWGYIDRSGRVVVETQYEFADDFSEGLAGVAVDRKYGFINKAGKMVIAPRFALRRELRHPGAIISSGRFSEGLAFVSVTDSSGYGGQRGYINKRGKFVIPLQSGGGQDFSEGLAWVVKDPHNRVAGKAGWIDKTGRWVVTKVQGRTISFGMPEFFSYTNGTYDWRYSEGLVPFLVYIKHKNLWGKDEDRVLWGYMDRKGKVVIKPILVYYAASRVCGVGMGPEGKLSIEPRQYSVNPFLGGIARVDFSSSGMEKVYGYIDKQGRFIWRSQN